MDSKEVLSLVKQIVVDHLGDDYDVVIFSRNTSRVVFQENTCNDVLDKILKINKMSKTNILGVKTKLAVNIVDIYINVCLDVFENTENKNEMYKKISSIIHKDRGVIYSSMIRHLNKTYQNLSYRRDYDICLTACRKMLNLPYQHQSIQQNKT